MAFGENPRPAKLFRFIKKNQEVSPWGLGTFPKPSSSWVAASVVFGPSLGYPAGYWRGADAGYDRHVRGSRSAMAKQKWKARATMPSFRAGLIAIYVLSASALTGCRSTPASNCAGFVKNNLSPARTVALLQADRPGTRGRSAMTAMASGVAAGGDGQTGQGAGCHKAAWIALSDFSWRKWKASRTVSSGQTTAVPPSTAGSRAGDAHNASGNRHAVHQAKGAGTLGRWLIRVGIGIVTLAGWVIGVYTWVTGRPPPMRWRHPA